MARRRKTPATDTMPVQSINPQSSQTKKHKPKNKMDAAGMQSWAKVLSDEKPALPTAFTDNLGAYAGPTKKKNRRYRGKKNGQAAPTPAAQPLGAPTPATSVPVVSPPAVPVSVAPAPVVPVPVVPASVVPGAAAQLPAVRTSTIPTPARVVPAIPFSTVSHWAAIAAPTPSVPAVSIRPVVNPAVVIPARITPATTVQAAIVPAVIVPAIPAVLTPAIATSDRPNPASPNVVVPVPVAATSPTPAPVISAAAVPTQFDDKHKTPQVPAQKVPKKVKPVKIPTLWDLYPAYSGKNLPASNSHLGFRYNREWVSFGAPAKDVGGLLQREFKRQRRAGLPPLYTDIAEEHLEPLKKVYSKAGELGLFHKRLAIRRSGQRRDAYPASYTSPAEKENGAFLNEENPLVHLLSIPELATRLLNNLKPCMRDILSLATICRQAAICVSGNLEVWDIRSGEFFLEDHFKGEKSGLRSNIVVVTPTKSGLPVTVSPYSTDFRSMARILSGMGEMRFSFQDLVLDKIPFLDCKIVEVIVNSMPNLKTIGISNCVLLDITKLEPLLDVIDRHPIVSERDGENAVYVQMDWQPFFFNGLNGRDTSDSPGSFGVTHNPPTFNIPKAVFGLIMKALPLAKKVGMDLLSEGSSFWRFVRRLPGPDVLWATKARDAIAVYELGLAAITNSDGSIPVKVLKEAKNTFADDITAALSGDGVEPIVVPGRFNAPSRGLSFAYGYWRGERKCCSCDNVMLRAFFPIHTKVCWPCKMAQFVNTAEFSHMRHRLQSTVDFWTAGHKGFEHPTVENITLNTLVDIKRVGSLNALNAAKDIDYAWLHHLAHTTGPRGHEPLYPEPTNARPNAVWFRRSLMVRDDIFPKGDYREGGPQYEHPALLPIFPEMQTDPTTKGCEPYEHFCATWVYNDKSEAALAQFFLDAKAVTERWDGNINDQRVQSFLAGARENLKQQIKARELEWIAQNEANSKWYMEAMADVEDCIVSNIGPGPRSWNRDAVKNAERALEPMNLFGEYMGKNNFQN